MFAFKTGSAFLMVSHSLTPGVEKINNSKRMMITVGGACMSFDPNFLLGPAVRAVCLSNPLRGRRSPDQERR